MISQPFVAERLSDSSEEVIRMNVEDWRVEVAKIEIELFKAKLHLNNWIKALEIKRKKEGLRK